MSTVSLERESTSTGLLGQLSRPGRPATRRVLMRTMLILAIALLAWQPVSLFPAPGLDLSWTAGLAMAVHSGVTFGNHAIFTYGPLGFLSHPTIWYGDLSVIAFAYTWLVRVGLAYALFAGCRRTFGSVISFVIAVVVASETSQIAEPVIVLIVMVGILTGELAPRHPVLLSSVAGAVAGAQLLNKISIGIMLTAMTAVFVFSLPRRRRESLLASGLAGAISLLILWFATGQSLGALPDYVGHSEQIVSGYASAMALSVGGLGWQATAAIFALILGVWAALQMTGGLGGRQRVGTLIQWLTLWFLMFKEGFVRHEGGHSTLFFAALLGGFFAFGWRAGSRLTALVCATALLTFVLASEGSSLGADLHPTGSVREAITETRDVLSPSRRARIVAAGRAGIEASEPIDPRALSLLRGHTVAVYPTEIALAWAHGLDWDPLPVLQSYSAYTTTLDETDAHFLTSSGAPARILLRAEPGIDGRVASFDEGLTIRTMLCRYRELYQAAPTAVLALGSDRCSTPMLLSTTQADWGQVVNVPAPPNPRSLVFVRISGVDVGGLERLRALLFKPALRFVVINGVTHRLVPGTAGDGLPLRASPGTDFRPPFSVAPGAISIAVLKQGHGPTGSRPIRFAFYAQNVGPG